MRCDRWMWTYHERPYFFLAQDILTTNLALSIYQFGDVCAYARKSLTALSNFMWPLCQPLRCFQMILPPGIHNVISSHQGWYQGWSMCHNTTQQKWLYVTFKHRLYKTPRLPSWKVSTFLRSFALKSCR